ncbi:alpha/beta fold hydrolase [Polaribacter sp. Z022]|uniref:alpha/beta hydrolase family protein n=1 Tax=Polaribacter sp. Z022 TaxID=2927125 RepID=UPI0020214705|nr:alpha/beta fold hydrolase [Polaribacter sp. Z022]MCL7752513.1 alpha/beta fold hydrolase [Polaribacter sp. Z022]
MKKVKNFSIEGKHQKPIVTDVFYKEDHQPKKVIIFCHGYKGFKDWGAWNLMAEDFAKAGFFFIKFNFSHNGGTLEQPIDFPDLDAFGNNNYSKELDDLGAVIDWISAKENYKNEVDINNISIIGHSRGGGIVLLKSAEDIRVKKVITLAGVCDFEKRTATVGDLDQWKKEGVKYVLNGRTKQNMPHFYQFYEDFIQNKERLNVRKATENLEIPHLIIHGNADTSVLINEAESLKEWNLKSEFKIIEGANHVFNVSHPWTKKSVSKELLEVIDDCKTFLLK